MKFKLSRTFGSLQINFKQHVPILITLCLIGINSCIRPDFIDPSSSKSITIEEAQKWYSVDRKPLIDKIFKEKQVYRMAYWLYARMDTLVNGRLAVVVPLLYNFEPQVSIRTETKFEVDNFGYYRYKLDRIERRITTNLIVAKDKNGNFEANVVFAIPTDDNRKKNPELKSKLFSGTVLVFDETETVLLKGFWYQDGKFMDSFDQKSNIKAKGLSNCGIAIYRPSGIAPVDIRPKDILEKSRANPTGVPDHFYSSHNEKYDRLWRLEMEIPANCSDGDIIGVPYKRVNNTTIKAKDYPSLLFIPRKNWK